MRMSNSRCNCTLACYAINSIAEDWSSFSGRVKHCRRAGNGLANQSARFYKPSDGDLFSVDTSQYKNGHHVQCQLCSEHTFGDSKS